MDEKGSVFIVDRVQDMIVSGGENVYFVEFENALARHPAVAQCAVIGVLSDKWGEDVHGVVVFKSDAKAIGAELTAHCRDPIAGCKCPRTFEFKDALPLTGAPAGRADVV